jgi:hypothetical protein
LRVDSLHVKYYELVLRREGESGEVISMGFEHLIVGQPFSRDGTDWVVAADDGSAVRFPGHVTRLICEPAEEDLGAV